MGNESVTILAVDDSADGLFTLEAALTSEGYTVVTATNGTEALRVARTHAPDLILLDVNMPEPDGYEVTRELKADPELRFSTVVLLTAKSELDDVVYGLAQGADDYMRKPYQRQELLARVAAALRVRKLYQELRSVNHENQQLRSQAESRSSYANIIGSSPAMHKVFDLVEKVKDAEVPVLIHGESGTGKELIASALHYQSVRRNKPFVVQNCAALHEHLLESELFGHVRGAFTGALRDKIGLFQAADEGTLFLDEIGEMSAALQAKLLRVLQDGTFTPVGATQQKRVSVRVVAATHRDLSRMVKAGSFREDLYYRLNVVTIQIPAVRERTQDIPLLLNYFLAEKAKRSGVVRELTPQAVAALCKYPWPGNVREIQSEVERLVLLSGDARQLGLEHLSPGITGGAEGQASRPSGLSSLPLKDAIAELERTMLAKALKDTGGNKSEAARVLGVSRSSLISKVQEYKLEDPQAATDE
jgi:DNA-binding NtrC family response regulator